MPIFPYKGMTKQYTLHIWDIVIVRVRHEKCWIQNCRKSISSNTFSNNTMYSFTFSTYWHCYFFSQNPKTDSPTPLELNPWQGAPKTKNPCPLGLEERVLSCLGTHIREGWFLERYGRCRRSHKSLRVPPTPPHAGSLVHGHTGLFSTPRMAAQLHPGPLHLPYLSRNRPSLICVPKQDRTRSSIPRGQGFFGFWSTLSTDVQHAPLHYSAPWT